MKSIGLVYLVIIHFSLSSQLQHIQIGAIFYENEEDIETAFNEAIYNTNSKYTEFKLVPIKRYVSSETSDSIYLEKLVCDLIGNGVSGIFGPSSKTSSDIVSIMSNLTGIPNILFDWSKEELMTERIKRRMTVNVAPSTTVISKAYADILNMYPWKGFTLLYESEDALLRLQDILQTKYLHTEIKIIKISRGDDFRALWKSVRHRNERRVILDCPPDLLAEVVNASVFYNMTGQFNNMFLTNLETHKSQIRLLNNERFRVNLTAVRMELNTNDLIEDTSLVPTLVFDAVVLFANAINNVITSGQYFEHQPMTCGSIFGDDQKWAVGSLILEQMLATTEENCTFITKDIKFNEWGERISFNLEIFRPMTERVISVWQPDGQIITKNVTNMKASVEVRDYSLGRRTYRVASRLGRPYMMEKKANEETGEVLTGNNRYEGYAVDLINKLSIEVGFDYIFEIVEGNQYGKVNPETKEWDGIIGYLVDHKADIGICDLTITQSRKSAVDFTVPFMQLGISILYYKKPPEKKELFAFLLPFDVEVWMYMLTSYLIIALVSIVMARLSRDEWENPHPCNPNPEELENKWGIANTAWLTMGSLMAQGCDILPRSGPYRLMEGMWWFFSLIMLSSYTANLAAFLTASKMENSVNGIEDLANQNKIQFGTVSGGSTSNYFSESNDTLNRLAWSKMLSTQPTVFTKDNAEGVERVRKGEGKYAFLMETTSMQYAIDNDIQCQLLQIGSQIGEKHYGIAVPLGADYRSNISVAILKLSERGELFKLKKKWWKNAKKDCASANESDGTELSIEELGGVFIVLGIGVAISFVLGIIEFLWNVQEVAVEEMITPKEALKSELLFAVKFWIKKKPVRTSGSSSASRSRSSTSHSSRGSGHSQTSMAKKLGKKVSIAAT